MAILVVVAAHLLIIVGLGAKRLPSIETESPDAITVSLAPALLLREPPVSVSKPEDHSLPAQINPVVSQVADVSAVSAAELKPQQMTVDETAKPFLLSAAAPETTVSDNAPSTPPQANANCNLAHTIATSLQSNAQVVASLSHIPRRAKSVANAIMLWDGDWPSANAFGGPDVLAGLRETVDDAILSAPLACQSQIELGPRLMAIRDDVGTTVIAIGSGAWRWSDLVASGAGRSANP